MQNPDVRDRRGEDIDVECFKLGSNRYPKPGHYSEIAGQLKGRVFPLSNLKKKSKKKQKVQPWGLTCLLECKADKLPAIQPFLHLLI
jgi:hypothetical protein